MILLPKGDLCGIRNRYFLNPFYLFGTIWAFIVLFYRLSLFTIYPGLSTNSFFFFAALIVGSFILGYLFDRCVLKKLSRELIRFYVAKPPLPLFFACLAFAVLGLALNRSFPLMRVLSGDIHSYGSFEIPYFNTFYVSLYVILNLRASMSLFYGEKKHRLLSSLMVAYVYFYFFLLYSRGMILYCLAMTMLVFLSRVKLNPARVLAVFLLVLFVAYLFSGFGNLRNGSSWSDASIVCGLAGLKGEHSYLTPFAGAVVYAETPLGNLLYNAPLPHQLTVEKLLYILLPDFLAKRLFPDLKLTLELPSPALTVGTMFAQAVTAGGTIGILIQYLEMALLFFVLPLATRKNTDLSLMVTLNLSVISIFTVFDNLLLLWGFSFSIVLLFFVSFFYHGRHKIRKEVYQVYEMVCVNRSL